MLAERQVYATAPNARYARRSDGGRSPAAAINAGAAIARGRFLALMVDGARLLSPGVVAGILAARGLDPEPVVSVPGYHLGQQLHQDAVHEGYGSEQEQEALRQLDWLQDGYRLFDMAVPSASCSGGYLQPIGESNCIAVSRRLFDRLQGFDEGFVTMGGGYVNLDFYRRAVDAGTLVLLPGEGTFHQFHGGATTGAPGVDRDRLLREMRAEYERLRGGVHHPPRQTPLLLGRMEPSAVRFLDNSVRRWQEVNPR
jgi:GT2 family glycosyltransferase